MSDQFQTLSRDSRSNFYGYDDASEIPNDVLESWINATWTIYNYPERYPHANRETIEWRIVNEVALYEHLLFHRT